MLQIEVGIIENDRKTKFLNFSHQDKSDEKMSKFRILVKVSGRGESASHQPLLDLMSSNGRPKSKILDMPIRFSKYFGIFIMSRAEICFGERSLCDHSLTKF